MCPSVETRLESLSSSFRVDRAALLELAHNPIENCLLSSVDTVAEKIGTDYLICARAGSEDYIEHATFAYFNTQLPGRSTDQFLDSLLAPFYHPHLPLKPRASLKRVEKRGPWS
jgi:hypothetical protein